MVPENSTKKQLRHDSTRRITVGCGYLYDVATDGQRFLAEVPPEQRSDAEPLTVVLNWTAGLKI